MKKKSARMQRVHGLAASEEKSSCRAMGEAQRLLDEQLQRLNELQAYRHEYSSRRPTNGIVNSAQWADYQNFLSRLDDAVHAQAQLVAEGERNRDAHRAQWQGKRMKMNSLQRVVERCRDDEQREAQRESQRRQDELPAPPGPFDRH